MKINGHELARHQSIVAEMCFVTPPAALALLEKNTHNRKLSEATVGKYAEEIKSGQWLPVPQGIGLDDQPIETLMDGQHRLAAIVKANEGAWLLIVRNLPAAAQEKIDRQKRRVLAEAFALSGLSASREVVQTATYLARLVTNAGGNPADCDVRNAVGCHGESLVVVCGSTRKHDRGMSQVGFRAAMVLCHEVHPQKAVEFMEKVQSPLHSTADDPAFRLRCVLTSTSVKACGGGTLQQQWSFRRTLYAFNAYSHGRKLLQVREAEEVEL